jgi:hypothetical protein
MIRWMGEGLSNQFTVFDESALDVIEREMTSAMKVLKTSLYKEEFI